MAFFLFTKTTVLQLYPGQVTCDILKLVKSLLKQYDGIIVLKDGHVIETGTFENLMEQKGYFHALYTVAQ